MMNSSNSSDNGFLKKLTEIIETNLTNPKFGVSMLAKELAMSRSNLHRKVNSLLKISVSQFINQVRLKKAKELLRHTSNTVSEITYEVGFSNPSYFIKCFHKYYGYSPGEVGNREAEESDFNHSVQSRKKRLTIIVISLVFLFLLAAVLFVVFQPFTAKQNDLEKTIVVLPATYNSNDSTNLHYLDGVMDLVISDLSKIKDIKKVIPRTSVKKYMNTNLTVSEISKEQNVNYIVESLGQKYGDTISFNVTLINTVENKPIWSKLFEEKKEDFFKLKTDISKQIADGIESRITPEEKVMIEKKYTNDTTAWDFYLKGFKLLNVRGGDMWYSEKHDNLEQAVKYFEKALKHDNEFALAYAELAHTYFRLDKKTTEKKYSNLININAEKALFYDPYLSESLIAKALYWRNENELDLALDILKRALQYNPNSGLAIQQIDLINWLHTGDIEYLLENALRAISLNISIDSINKSMDYFRLSRAFRFAGFAAHAKLNIEKSLEMNPHNLYALDEKAQYLGEIGGDYQQAKELLIESFNKDSSMVDIIRNLGLTCYLLRDYDSAYKYFNKYNEKKGSRNIDAYRGDNGRIALIHFFTGRVKESEEYLSKHINYTESTSSFLKNRYLLEVYSYKGDTAKAIEQMKIFLQLDNYPYWVIRIFKDDPLYDNIRDLDEFHQILSEMEIKFWENHARIKNSLEKKGLM